MLAVSLRCSAGVVFACSSCRTGIFATDEYPCIVLRATMASQPVLSPSTAHSSLGFRSIEQLSDSTTKTRVASPTYAASQLTTMNFSAQYIYGAGLALQPRLLGSQLALHSRSATETRPRRADRSEPSPSRLQPGHVAQSLRLLASSPDK
jgi:hypothetical protein